ncbi:hypothetical protein HNY73_008591 [Argiope bruennichi]|uniref:Uncharacterized protein n=1 Tax=Argiope bruennichi TaxID=94029 RepID=A0A8T0F9R6_ARGBR|nr:hypothetical protein HNY73_008591 [Argiope bruennichi]
MTRQLHQPHASLDHFGFGDDSLHVFGGGGPGATPNGSQPHTVQQHHREASAGSLQAQCHLGILNFIQGNWLFIQGN